MIAGNYGGFCTRPFSQKAPNLAASGSSGGSPNMGRAQDRRWGFYTNPVQTRPRQHSA